MRRGYQIAKWSRRAETLHRKAQELAGVVTAGWADDKLAGWARNWHWNDCAEDRPIDPSIYFRDLRMLKAFVGALQEEDIDRVCDCDPARVKCACTCERAVHEDGT